MEYPPKIKLCLKCTHTPRMSPWWGRTLSQEDEQQQLIAFYDLVALPEVKNDLFSNRRWVQQNAASRRAKQQLHDAQTPSPPPQKKLEVFLRRRGKLSVVLNKCWRHTECFVECRFIHTTLSPSLPPLSLSLSLTHTCSIPSQHEERDARCCERVRVYLQVISFRGEEEGRAGRRGEDDDEKWISALSFSLSLSLLPTSEKEEEEPNQTAFTVNLLSFLN